MSPACVLHGRFCGKCVILSMNLHIDELYFIVYKWPVPCKTKETGSGFNEELYNIELQESLEFSLSNMGDITKGICFK